MFDDIHGPVLASHGAMLAEKATRLGVRRALDVGAGSGVVTRALRSCGVAVVAVEPSRGLAGRLVASAGRGPGAAEVWLGRAEELSAATLPIEPVDLVLFAFGVVDYVTDDGALLRGLKGARELTAAGGRCWIQPTPRGFIQDSVATGPIFRREIKISSFPGDRLRVHHRVLQNGVLEVEESLFLRFRTIERISELAAAAGWEFEGLDGDGVYPTVLLRRKEDPIAPTEESA
jgi:SAM-dependent methyltransferase